MYDFGCICHLADLTVKAGVRPACLLWTVLTTLHTQECIFMLLLGLIGLIAHLSLYHLIFNSSNYTVKNRVLRYTFIGVVEEFSPEKW